MLIFAVTLFVCAYRTVYTPAYPLVFPALPHPTCACAFTTHTCHILRAAYHTPTFPLPTPHRAPCATLTPPLPCHYRPHSASPTVLRLIRVFFFFCPTQLLRHPYVHTLTRLFTSHHHATHLPPGSPPYTPPPPTHYRFLHIPPPDPFLTLHFTPRTVVGLVVFTPQDICIAGPFFLLLHKNATWLVYRFFAVAVHTLQFTLHLVPSFG